MDGAKACTNFSYDFPSWTKLLNSFILALLNFTVRAPNHKERKGGICETFLCVK